jgi:hypothetical protein
VHTPQYQRSLVTALYAESLEDDLNDIFLKRSYWGTGEAAAAPYGISAKADDKADAEARQRWATQGMKEEVSGFNALAVGFKSTLEWTDGKMVIAKVETANGGEKRRVSYTLAVQGAAGQALLKDERKDAELELDEGRYVLKVKLPVDPATWKAAQWASFDYKLYEEFERNVIAGDVLQVKKPA